MYLKMEPVDILLSFIIPFLLASILNPMVGSMLNEAGSVKKNYRGDMIPCPMGISLLLSSLSGYFASLCWYAGDSRIRLAMAAGLGSIGIMGLMDDLLGDRSRGGFSGHFKALFHEGRLTTGAVKAFFGGIVAFGISALLSSGFINIILNGLILALAVNFINLLDLRPGRAIKAFLAFAGLLSAAAGLSGLAEAAPLIGGLIPYIPFDFKGRGMMGDTGSNALGLALGVIAIRASGLLGRVLILLFLAFVTVYSERRSISDLIERSRILSAIDRFGIRQ